MVTPQGSNRGPEVAGILSPPIGPGGSPAIDEMAPCDVNRRTWRPPKRAMMRLPWLSTDMPKGRIRFACEDNPSRNEAPPPATVPIMPVVGFTARIRLLLVSEM